MVVNFGREMVGLIVWPPDIGYLKTTIRGTCSLLLRFSCYRSQCYGKCDNGRSPWHHHEYPHPDKIQQKIHSQKSNRSAILCFDHGHPYGMTTKNSGAVLGGTIGMYLPSHYPHMYPIFRALQAWNQMFWYSLMVSQGRLGNERYSSPQSRSRYYRTRPVHWWWEEDHHKNPACIVVAHHPSVH